MNFKLWEHIVRNAIPKKKEEKRSLKKTNKLPQRQPAKEQSPDMQLTDSSLRVVKTDGYAEGHAG